MVSKSEGSNFWHYTFDNENRLAKAATRRQTARYRYDALGRRVQRYIVGGKENTKYTYDGDDVLLDDDDGTLTKYLNGPGIDNKLRLQTGSTASYFLSDHLGSTNGLTNSSGSLTSQTSYDAFGNQTGTLATRYGFTGRERDDFSGLMYYRARFYDPNLGRFISEDPIGFGGGDVNLYGYVKNQPLWFRDPRGLQPGEDAMADPNIWRAAASALGALGGYAAAAAPPVAVGLGGLGAGVAIGYYPGKWSANSPWNPFVNGPLNPFRTWDKLWEPTPYPGAPPRIPTTTTGPACQPMPRAIPWTRSPSIPWPTTPPDREGCAQEWADAYEWCAMNIGKPDSRGGTGGHSGLQACAAGRVSQRCGGNAIDWGN